MHRDSYGVYILHLYAAGLISKPNLKEPFAADLCRGLEEAPFRLNRMSLRSSVWL